MPLKVLAVSFMVNDKFRFVKPEKNIENVYKYLGVRKSTNSTYTSSIMQNVFYSVVEMMKTQTVEELEKVLSVLHFDSMIEISFKHTSSNDNLKSNRKSSIKKYKINCSAPDYKEIYSILNDLEHAAIFLDDKEKSKCNIIFFKNRRGIQFSRSAPI